METNGSIWENEIQLENLSVEALDYKIMLIKPHLAQDALTKVINLRM